MIKCMRDGEKTIVSASGETTQIAADCCEVIRAIYFECEVIHASYFELPPVSDRVVIRAEGGELLKQAKDLLAAEAILRRGGSMTIVNITKAQCAELANYLRAILNKGVGAGCFDKIEMLVLARLALESAEDLPENVRSPAPPYVDGLVL